MSCSEELSRDTILKREIGKKRKELLEAAVSYIHEGSDGTQKERLREASDIALIPRWVLETELKLKQV